MAVASSLVGVLLLGQTWGALVLNFGTEMAGAAATYLLLGRVIGRRERQEADERALEEKKASLPAHHLYVCEDGAYELRKHFAFRDFMRQHPEWRERLNQLKKELCLKHNNNREAYIDGKAAMVEEITRLAMLGSG